VRRISAHYIFPGDGTLLKYGILEVDTDGTVLNIRDTAGIPEESHGVEFYNGILVPGLVNAHCHLELSHLKGKVKSAPGLVPFLNAVLAFRSEICPYGVMEQADLKMESEGVVAVGDISNTDHSFPVKQKSRLYYHTFIEGASMDPLCSEKVMTRLRNLVGGLEQYGLKGSLCPHAPYSVSDELFEKLLEEAIHTGLPVSVHHQESFHEDLLFLKKEGDFVPFIEQQYPGFKTWIPPGKTSFDHLLLYFLRFPRLLLVHNTFSKPEKLGSIPGLSDSVALVLCPRSNLMLEGRLPDVEGLYRTGLRIALGTDSLASNHELSILSEMKVLQDAFPEIPLTTLLRWATLNGAWALGLESCLGSFTPGFRPGINLIENVDLQALRLLEKTRIRRIL